MKRIAIFAPLCLALALVASGTPESVGQDKKEKGKGGGAFHPGAVKSVTPPAVHVLTPPPAKGQPPAKVQPPPVKAHLPPAIDRTPGIGSIQPTVKSPIPAPVVKQPPAVVKEKEDV